MSEFIKANLMLVLSIIGLVLGFLVSVTEFVTKRKPVRFLFVIAILGLVVAVTYQIHDYNQKQIEVAAQKARDGIIDEININVQETKTIVSSIAERLETTRLSEVATALITIRTSGEARFEEAMAFAKGSPKMWHRYAEWLINFNGNGVAPSLSVTFNARHHYKPGLLLAYLLTSKNTRNDVGAVMDDRSKWDSFDPVPLYLKNFEQDTKKIRWVLFYDGSERNLVGFADAEAFTRELIVYHRLGKHKEVEKLLNQPSEPPILALQKSFPSVQTAIFATKNPSDLVQAMIQQQLALSVAAAGPNPYIVRLERMIQLAARGS